MREGSKLADMALNTAAAFAALITIYPVYYVLILSLSEPAVAATMRVYILPRGLYLDSYARIFGDARLWLTYRNTLMYAICEAALMLATCSTFAYALSVKRLRGRWWINLFLLIPMYVSGGVIPNFLLIVGLGLYNTPWALILTGGYSMWYIILMKAYFGTIPESLREAARIDGASHYQVLWRVYLPTSLPIVAVVALYTVVGVWNSWFAPALYLSGQRWQPLQLYLRRILVEQTIDLAQEYASTALALEAQALQLSNAQLKYTIIVVSTLPMLLAYPFFQRYFVKGVLLGSLKE